MARSTPNGSVQETHAEGGGACRMGTAPLRKSALDATLDWVVGDEAPAAVFGAWTKMLAPTWHIGAAKSGGLCRCSLSFGEGRHWHDGRWPRGV